MALLGHMQISKLQPWDDQLLKSFVFAQLNSAEVGSVEGIVGES
jgi:hypothetical protein